MCPATLIDRRVGMSRLGAASLCAIAGLLVACSPDPGGGALVSLHGDGWGVSKGINEPGTPYFFTAALVCTESGPVRLRGVTPVRTTGDVAVEQVGVRRIDSPQESVPGTGQGTLPDGFEPVEGAVVDVPCGEDVTERSMLAFSIRRDSAESAGVSSWDVRYEQDGSERSTRVDATFVLCGETATETSFAADSCRAG